MKPKNKKFLILFTFILMLILFLNLSVKSEDIDKNSSELNLKTNSDNVVESNSKKTSENSLETTLENNLENNIANESNEQLNEIKEEIIYNYSKKEESSILNQKENLTDIYNISQSEIKNTSLNDSEDNYQNITSINQDNLLNNLSNQSNIDSNITNESNKLIEKKDLINNNGNFVNTTEVEDIKNEGSIKSDSIENTRSSYIYIAIEDAVNETIINESIKNIQSTNISIKKINITLSKDGKKELEGEIPENFDVNSIEKSEILISKNWSKQVTIKSKNHLDSPLEVYSDIPKINKENKDKIKLIWVNENKTISPNIFYDVDKDGLYDRISWIVPHLSDQIFKISIDLQTNSELNYSEINISLISFPNGSINNPLNFRFNITSENIENINCTLFIGSYFYLLNPNLTEFNYNLPNGNYTWYLKCWGNNDSKQTEQKSFVINESYSVTTDQKNYLLGENVIVNLTSNKNIDASLYLFKQNSSENKTFIINTNTKNFILNISKENFTSPGIYYLQTSYNNLQEPYFLNFNISISKASLDILNTSLRIGDEVNINVNITSPNEKISSIILDFGDGASNISYFNINENNKNILFKHRFVSENNYSIKLNTIINNRNFEIIKNISVLKSLDTEAPIINLIYPDDGVKLNISQITFSYNVSDNIKITNCTFELYNNSGIIGILNYSKTELNPDNTTKNITLGNLGEGKYSWIVECTDNSSNTQYVSKDFRISFNLSVINTSTVSNTAVLSSNINSSDLDEISNIISNLNSFLTKKESYDMDQKQVLEDIGISKDLDYFNKRLSQINQDLTNNVAYIQDKDARQNRINELFEEAKNLSKKIPSDLEIYQKNNFVKNSITNDIGAILGEYYSYIKLSLTKSQINSLANKILGIQKYISTSTKVRQIKLKINGEEKDLTLISKTIELKNESNNTVKKILEVIPNDLIKNNKISFINNINIINNTLYEISDRDLIDNKIIYSIDALIDPKEFEKTDTILYEELPLSSSGITGLSILDFDTSFKKSLFYSIIASLIVFFIMSIFSLKKLRMAKWKKDENVLKMFSLIKEAKKNLEAKEFVSAKGRYNEIKSLYLIMPEKCKKYIYKSIEEIRNSLDKKDISILMKEYEEAKQSGRNEDANKIYEKIKSNYKKLPKKYQEKVFQKMFKNSF